MRGDRYAVGCGFSTEFADFDFETFSTAGYVFDGRQYQTLGSGNKHGLKAVGAAAYSEHESTEVLSLAYDLKDGRGPRLWVPGMPDPRELFDHISQGLELEACNSSFEFYIWKNVCVARMGWPELPFYQLRDAAAKARAWGMPGALETMGAILDTDVKKDTTGKALLKRFAMHRKPTGADGRVRILPADDPQGAAALYRYNITDIQAEADISRKLPDLSPVELELWLLDQYMNFEGVPIDVVTLGACEKILAEATTKYTAELVTLTDGAVDSPGQLARILKFLDGLGCVAGDLTADSVTEILSRDGLHPKARRVLEIRQVLGSASVKKVKAIRLMLCKDGRIRGLLQYCGAERTGRFAGRGPQPQNFPSGGPSVSQCSQSGCERYASSSLAACPWCGHTERHPADWCDAAAADAREVIKTGSLDTLEEFFGDPLSAISGCLRALFHAEPGHEFISSDYSAIEAVVLAVLAREQWRVDVFNGHGKIYEMSASKITGIPFEEFLRHKTETGDHHPMRKKVGKVAELACFGSDTLVLTNSGYKKIVDVTTRDLLHDGVEWVRHDGVINKGERLTLEMGGVAVTPEHKFYIGGSEWRTAEDLKENTHSLQRALYAAGSKLLQSSLSATPPGGKSERVGPPGRSSTSSGTSAAAVRTVYDVANCGPRSRFVVLTDQGPIIAHNSGYGGGLNAWKQFGADKFLTDEEIEEAKTAWRRESPNIKAFWYGLEDAARSAIQNPGHCFQHNDISYGVKDDVLYCQLPSGRKLAYHTPRLHPETTPWGSTVLKITFMGKDAKTSKWVRIDTYGGKLAENVAQAVARDILTHALPNLQRAGYHVAFHVHDEVVTHVPEGFGSIEELEAILGDLPDWAAGWPIKAAGGWRGKTFRKD